MSDDYAWDAFNDAADQQARDAAWDEREQQRHAAEQRRERFEERAGHGESRRAPRQPETCAKCGDRFWNYWAHAERCTGRRAA